MWRHRGYTLLSLLALLVLSLTSVACGSTDPEPSGTNANDDAGINDNDDAGYNDTNDDPDANDGTNDDPGYDPIVCEESIPEPPGDQRCSVEPGSGDNILIQGTLLVGDDVYEDGSLLVDDASPNRSIECSGCDCAEEEAAADATVVSCPDAVISPGLINPHDHLTYAEGWPQTHGEERFDHRHDWRMGVRGHTELSTTPRSGGHREVALWGELRMMMGGATSIAGSTGAVDASGLMRNLDDADETEGLTTIDVDYRTFPLGDAGFSEFPTSGCNYPNIDDEGRLGDGIYLPHLAEGIDGAAQNEIACTSGMPGQNLITDRTSIIHGIAVDARDVALMADRGANLVWSPRTNIDLYGNTAPVTLYERFDVPIALGTDWSTSGSMNMLRELECADYLNRMHFNDTFDEIDLWKMATYNAAVSMGAEHKLGSLESGYIADITIFDDRTRSAYRAVIDADVDDIALVMRGGEPMYGDAEIVEGLTEADGTDTDQCEMVDVCDRDRRACIELDTGQTLSDIESEIHPDSYPLFYCDEPEDEPTCVPSRPDEYDGIVGDSDSSGDGIPDSMDNCPDYFNPIRPMDGELQSNVNGTQYGDVCDPCPISEDTECTEVDPDDWSGDGIPNDDDNCPYHYNPDQEDSSGDGTGDICSPCPEHEITPGNPCPGSIYDVKTGDIPPGEGVALEDVVVTATIPGEGLFVQVHPDDDDYEGPENSGLYIYLGNYGGLTSDDFPAVGDRLDIIGNVDDFFGQIQLSSVDDLEVLSSDNDVPDPMVADADDLATGGSLEATYEGVLVTVDNVQVTDIDVPPGPGDSAPTNEFIVNDSLHINDFMYLVEPFPAVDDTIESITGVLRWANENNKLEPRSEDDVILGPPDVDFLAPEETYLEVASSPEPVLELHLDREADDPMSVDLDYSDSTVVSGPDSVDFAPGEQVANIDLQALVADPDPVMVTASGDDESASATVRTYDEDTDRVLESVSAEQQLYFAGNSFVIEASLNVPAGAPDETVDLDILPDSDATYSMTETLSTGQRTAYFDVDLGDDLGNFVAVANHQGTELTFPFQVVEATEMQVETFDNFSTSGSTYVDGTFAGTVGFDWTYLEAREAPTGGAPGIDGTSMILRDTSSSIGATDIPGGITEFSVDLKQAFTGSGDRQVELFIDGESQGTSLAFEGEGEIHEFELDGLDISGDFDMELVPTSNNQVTIDNLSWTSGSPVDPDDIDFPTAALDGFSPDLRFVEVGNTETMTIGLETPALEDVTVDLSYDDSTAVDGPDDVTFAVGDTSQDIAVEGLEGRDDPVEIEASYDGETVTGYIHPFDDSTARNIVDANGCPSALVGHPLELVVEIDVPAGEDGLTAPLTFQPDDLADNAPDDITFDEGQRTATVDVEFDSGGSVDIEVDTGDDESTVSVDVIDADPPLVEDFSAAPGSGNSYVDDSFDGVDDIGWDYFGARRTGSDAIDGDAALMFGADDEDPRSLQTDTVPGGLSSLSVDMKRGFSNTDDRQLELLVNGHSLGTSQIIGDDDQVYTFEVDDIDTTCVDSLEIRSIGDGQIVIDNLTRSPVDP